MTNLMVRNESVSVISKVAKITPFEAKKLISDTEGALQRVSNKATILEYAKMMLNGEWVLNYQPIQIGLNGNVLDGLHRLKACVLANCEFETAVVLNVPETSFNSIDRGRARTLGDILSSKNVENYNAVAASITVLHLLNENKYALLSNTQRGSATGGSNKKSRLSPNKMEEFLVKNPDFLSFVSDGLNLYRVGTKLVRQSLFIGLWYYCSKYNSKKSNSFFSKISTGASISADCPTYFIRKKLFELKNKEDYLKSTELINLILKGFDLYCKEEKIKSFFHIPKGYYQLSDQIKLF